MGEKLRIKAVGSVDEIFQSVLQVILSKTFLNLFFKRSLFKAIFSTDNSALPILDMLMHGFSCSCSTVFGYWLNRPPALGNLIGSGKTVQKL